MLEDLVSSLLVTYLEEFISNFDKNSLKIAIWSGDVTLKNLLLKTYALDNIHPNFPLVIAYGLVKSNN
jgi:vacuolar protein sorting-associated protein 13A/C